MTHSELVAQKLSDQALRCASLTNDLAEARKDSADARIDLAKVRTAFSEYKSRLINEEVVTVEWTISDATAQLSSNATLKSKDFALESAVCSSVMYLKCDLKATGEMGFQLCKSSGSSTSKCSVSVGGSMFTLKHPTDPTKDLTRYCPSVTEIVEPSWSLKWDMFASSTRPYISAEDKIAFKCVIRFQEVAVAAVEL